MSGTKFDETDLQVCTVCIHLLANGEFNDGTDAAEVTGNRMAELWGDDARHLSPGSEEQNYGFSTWPCEGCGDTDHGDRFHAVALIPVLRLDLPAAP